MIENFEEWKKGLLESYKIFMYGDDPDGVFAKKFCEYVDSIDFLTEEIGDILFSLFTDEDDGEVLESVCGQLFDANDKSITTRCLLKAFPRLCKEAKEWAECFLYNILRDTSVYQGIINSEDAIGKQSIIDFIKKLNEDPPHESCLKNEKLMQAHLDDLARFNKLSRDIQNSMKSATS
jgi:hypothetical protein